jgi:hypothetical protein
VLNEPLRNFDRLDMRHWQAERLPQTCGQHFICENSDVLGIVPELRDVEGAVGCHKKMRLRSSTQATNVLDSRDASAHKAPPFLLLTGNQQERVIRLGRNRRVKESNESRCAKRAADSLPHPLHCLGWAAPSSRATTMACSVLRLSTWSSELNFRDRRIPA